MDETKQQEAFVKIIEQHERIVYKVCLFYATNDIPLVDLYQDTICNLWNGFKKFRNECSVTTWMYRVALNTCITNVRKEMRQPSKIPVASLVDYLAEQESCSSDEKLQEMYKLIEQLSNIEKAIVLLYLENRSYQEIAEITGLTVANVASKLKRAKMKLKQMSNLITE